MADKFGGVFRLHDVDPDLKLVIRRARLPGVAKPGDALLNHAEILVIAPQFLGRAHIELEAKGLTRRDRPADRRDSRGRNPGLIGEETRPLARLGRRKFRARSPALAARIFKLDISGEHLDRKSTRLNSSHVRISYA